MQTTILKQISTIAFPPEKSGILLCGANNSEGTKEVNIPVIVNDLDESEIN